MFVKKYSILYEPLKMFCETELISGQRCQLTNSYRVTHCGNMVKSLAIQNPFNRFLRTAVPHISFFV